MTTYSRADRLAAIQAAGFKNPLTALSVSLAEFGENRDINAQSQSDYVANGLREPSFGPWQIHLPSHPDVTQACAMELTCSTQYAAKLSNGGTDFGPWSAFTNGSYKTFLTELEGPIHALASAAPSASGGASLDPGTSGSAQSGGDNCRPLNWLELWLAAKANYEHQPLETIASNFGITVACLGINAGRGSGELSQTPVLQTTDKAGAALAALASGAGGLSKFTDLLKPENLWRAAFVIVGAGAVFLGGRMYLHNDSSEVAPSSGDGSWSTEAPTAEMRNRGVRGTAGVS